eukprot:gene6544-7840_t
MDLTPEYDHSDHRREPESEFDAPDTFDTKVFRGMDRFSCRANHGVSLYDPGDTRLYNLAAEWRSMYKKAAYPCGVVMAQPKDCSVALGAT